MASTVEFATFVTEQLGGSARGVTCCKMFREYDLYCHELFFGVICDDALYMKPTKAGEALLAARDALALAPPYQGTKNYLLFENLDDTALLAELLDATLDALPPPKPKKKREPKPRATP